MAESPIPESPAALSPAALSPVALSPVAQLTEPLAAVSPTRQWRRSGINPRLIYPTLDPPSKDSETVWNTLRALRERTTVPDLNWLFCDGELGRVAWDCKGLANEKQTELCEWARGHVRLAPPEYCVTQDLSPVPFLPEGALSPEVDIDTPSLDLEKYQPLDNDVRYELSDLDFFKELQQLELDNVVYCGGNQTLQEAALAAKTPGYSYKVCRGTDWFDPRELLGVSEEYEREIRKLQQQLGAASLSAARPQPSLEVQQRSLEAIASGKRRPISTPQGEAIQELTSAAQEQTKREKDAMAALTESRRRQIELTREATEKTREERLAEQRRRAGRSPSTFGSR